MALKWPPEFVRKYPVWSTIGAILFFLIVTFPIWLVQVWQLGSDKPFLEDVKGTKWEFLVIGPQYGWFAFAVGCVLCVLLFVVIVQSASNRDRDLSAVGISMAPFNWRAISMDVDLVDLR